MEKSQVLVDRGDYRGAAAALNELLLIDPSDVEVLFRLAQVESGAGNLSKSVEILSEIPEDHPQAGLAALGQSADWCVALERYDEAEQLYKRVLARAPNAAPALRPLAHLLNRQGRRHEAAIYIQELCKQGNVRQDELHALISLSDAMYDAPPESDQVPREPTAYWPIGASGIARKHFQDEQYADAIELLRPLVSEQKAPPAIVALFGRAAAEAQDEPSFRWWLSKSDANVREYSEYWAAIGAFLIGERRFEEAIRALAEAITRDPTDLRSLSRLRQAFLVLEDEELAQQFADRWTDIRESLRANNLIAVKQAPDLTAIEQLEARLNDLDRPLEALLWKAVQQYYAEAPLAEKQQVSQQRQLLVANGSPFPSTKERILGLDLEQFPLPTIDAIKPLADAVTSRETEHVITPARFVNTAPDVGLDHTFFVASTPTRWSFSIHQMLGGGVAVLDYELDGNPDLYFAQGASDPPHLIGERSNQLMRQVDASFTETTDAAGVAEFAHTVGVAAGDWNQDGFPDLVLRNLPDEVLLLNQGDGTFRRVQIADRSDSNRIPSSAAIADLTGDGLPDIFHADYVDDSRRFMKPPVDETGRPLQPILPSKFQPGKNHIVENNGSGGFEVRDLTPDDSVRDATSLGIIITDFDGKSGNEIFVANDLKPNRLWSFDQSTGWVDVAALRGCAFSFTGASTASMGVAAADLKNNGTIDLHVTNYQNESASLFIGESGLYQDQNLKLKIAVDSFGVLGFGTQAIDYDNDGLRDLVVTNGHIDDAVSNQGTFRQPAQLFANRGYGFELIPVEDRSEYWGEQHLGRTLASTDVNRDGLMDFVVTHIDEPSALLINHTETGNHWLQLQLVGTISERDSIGARVRVRAGDQEFVEWVTAGDGYLCTNENLVCFGLGGVEMVDSIEIQWPTGKQQIFNQVSVDRRFLIVEGEADPYQLSVSP
ncbi:MAG: FG-GAP-like repeat-containing protein [Rubripirellula sp.]|nr:FG-GAP-like repeat-containing protein [Rubripirellula sp.]